MAQNQKPSLRAWFFTSILLHGIGLMGMIVMGSFISLPDISPETIVVNLIELPLEKNEPIKEKEVLFKDIVNPIHEEATAMTTAVVGPRPFKQNHAVKPVVHRLQVIGTVSDQPTSPELNDAGVPQEYLTELRETIERAKRYPWMARVRGLEGTSLVKFQITIEGNVTEVEIVRPSRHEILDKAAVETILRAAPFPTFAKIIDVDHLEINLPLVFELQ
jgi:TonB family protein